MDIHTHMGMGISRGTCTIQSFLPAGKEVSCIYSTLPIYIDTILSYSVLPALSLDGIIHVKVVENAFTMDTFNQFINELLDKMNPYDKHIHLKNSVLIMDNCRIHKDLEMIERARVRSANSLPTCDISDI